MTQTKIKTREEQIAEIEAEMNKTPIYEEGRSAVKNLTKMLVNSKKNKAYNSNTESNYFQTAFSELFEKTTKKGYEGLAKLVDTKYFSDTNLDADLLKGVFVFGLNGANTTYSDLLTKIEENYDSARDSWNEGKNKKRQENEASLYKNPVGNLNYTLEKLGIEERLEIGDEQDFFKLYDATNGLKNKIDTRLGVLAKENTHKSQASLSNAIASLYIASRKIANIYEVKDIK
ncbi:hypothetical protein HN827_08380 [archaeon]|jgi:hypothetical protein|nr:hypothetical protein [archaeon]MBT4646820.1 hypothetical protein [archaeon]MBT6822240.1 hypothetical protein [archaeon]MBT7392821.1 hypothetical protein [archaeon]